MKRKEGCQYEKGELDDILGATACKNTVCPACELDEKECGLCVEKIEAGAPRIYDGDYPCHEKCYYDMFPWAKPKTK